MRGKADFYDSKLGKNRVISWPVAIATSASHLHTAMASLSLVIGVIGSLFYGSHSRLGAFPILGSGSHIHWRERVSKPILVTISFSFWSHHRATSYRSQHLIERIGETDPSSQP